MGSHPVAVVQYTYTHKQYRVRHKTNNTQNNTKIHRTQKIHRTTQKLGRVRAVPRLCGFKYNKIKLVRGPSYVYPARPLHQLTYILVKVYIITSLFKESLLSQNRAGQFYSIWSPHPAGYPAITTIKETPCMYAATYRVMKKSLWT
jgi:hypothetical protein